MANFTAEETTIKITTATEPNQAPSTRAVYLVVNFPIGRSSSVAKDTTGTELRVYRYAIVEMNSTQNRTLDGEIIFSHQ